MLFGAYCGNPHGNDTQEMAKFHANLDAFEAATGRPAQCMNAFADHRLHINDLVGNMGWTAWSWSQSPRAKAMIPVMGVPMAVPGWEAPGSYRATAEGAADHVWRGLAEQWRNNGFDRVYWRIGWEHNATHFPWGTHSLDDAELRAWIAAWRRIAQTIRSVEGMRHHIVWCPDFTSWEPRPWQDTYPGDDVVDVCAVDFYAGQFNPVSFVEGKGYFDLGTRTYVDWHTWLHSTNFRWPINRFMFWLMPGLNEWSENSSNALGLRDFREFARAHGKPLALGEGGSGIDPRARDRSLHDDEWYVWFLKDHFLPPHNDVAFMCLWDIDLHDGQWNFSNGRQNKVSREWRATLAGLPSPPLPPPTLEERVTMLEGRLKAAGIA